MASLRGIEQFFMQVRRRYSLLERTLNSASRVDRIWNIYSPYNPVVIQRLLNIYRVFLQLCQEGRRQEDAGDASRPRRRARRHRQDHQFSARLIAPAPSSASALHAPIGSSDAIETPRHERPRLHSIPENADYHRALRTVFQFAGNVIKDVGCRAFSPGSDLDVKGPHAFPQLIAAPRTWTHRSLTDQLAGFLDESAIHLELPETEFPIGVGQDLFDVGIRKVSEPVFLAAHAFCSDLSRTEAAISATDRRENRLARA
jgi:hypothetical protein